jgi:hypothetical protein
MDPLTHLFLPLVVLHAYRPELLESPRTLLIAFVGVFPDFDKFLGVIGLFHSLLVLVPVSIGLLLVGRELADRGIERAHAYAVVAVLLFGSHLLLDFLDGGPVTLLYPLVPEGIGLEYPMRILFGHDPLDVRVTNPLVRLRIATVRHSVHPYTPVDAFGVTSTLLFWTIYAIGYRARDRP